MTNLKFIGQVSFTTSLWNFHKKQQVFARANHITDRLCVMLQSNNKMDKTIEPQDSRPSLLYQKPTKISISTIYPIQLPKLKFYTQRPIHEQSSHNRQRQIPITFIRYLKAKHRRRYSSQPSTDFSQQPTMYITNSTERGTTINSFLTHSSRPYEMQADEVQKHASIEAICLNSGEREKGKAAIGLYKKKFGHRLRKSMDSTMRKQMLQKSQTNIQMLADGLKIGKIEIVESPRQPKQIINRAKFNTIVHEVSRKPKRWELGPWGQEEKQEEKF